MGMKFGDLKTNWLADFTDAAHLPKEEDKKYMDIWKGKQINQNYNSDICKYISTCVLFNTDQTLNIER